MIYFVSKFNNQSIYYYSCACEDYFIISTLYMIYDQLIWKNTDLWIIISFNLTIYDLIYAIIMFLVALLICGQIIDALSMQALYHYGMFDMIILWSWYFVSYNCRKYLIRRADWNTSITKVIIIHVYVWSSMHYTIHLNFTCILLLSLLVYHHFSYLLLVSCLGLCLSQTIIF